MAIVLPLLLGSSGKHFGNFKLAGTALLSPLLPDFEIWSFFAVRVEAINFLDTGDYVWDKYGRD
jgi:hypothetical protein